MIKNSQNQIGSAHVVIFVVLVAFIIGALGLVVWNNFINKEESQSSSTSSNGKSDSFTSPTQESDEKTYKNETIGISFTYPKQWVNLNCKDNPNIVFFASDSRGIGGDNDSLLCGGGSDFPPQMSFYIANGSVEIANDASSLIIDGLEAQKSVFVSSNESIRPEGFEITKYSVPLADGRTVVFTYSKWPKESTSSYDTSDETKQRFQDLVESSLTFI